MGASMAGQGATTPAKPLSTPRMGGPLALSVVGAVLVILSIAFSWLLSTSYYLSWWAVTGGSTTTSWGLFNQCVNGCYTDSGFGSVSNIWMVTSYLMVIALILGIIAIVAAARAMSGPMRSSAGTGVMALLAFIFAVVGPIWLLVGQPGAFPSTFCSVFSGGSPCSAFWGSGTAFGTSLSWAPWGGWYLAVVGAVVFLVAAIWAFAAGRKS